MPHFLGDIMRDISTIIQQNSKRFLDNIKSLSDMSRVHHIEKKNGGFPVFMIDNKEYYEQSYFDELIENSIWRFLVNGVLRDLFTPEYCSANNITFEWQEMHPQLTAFYVEHIEARYPIEFIIARNGKREGYRYTNCYISNKERYCDFLKSRNLDKLYVIDFSSATQSSFMHPLVVPKGLSGIVNRLPFRDFFCDFFTENEYEEYLSKAREAVKAAYQYVGKQTVTNLTYQQLPYFLKQALAEVLAFPYKTTKYKPTIFPSKDAQSWYGKGVLPKADMDIILSNYFDLERYQALVGKESFAKSFITSEYLYQTLTENNKFDLTAIVTGYLKSIEQLLFLILGIIENDSNSGEVWIQSTLKLGTKKYVSLFANGESRQTPGKNGRTQVKVNNNNRSFFDTSFAALAYMLEDYDDGWAVSPTAKDYISALLLTYCDECRNEHFHKDNIDDPEEVKEIRDKTYLLLFYLLGGYDFSKSSQDEKKNLGIIDSSFETLYQKIMEYGPGNYYYLRFGSDPPILVAMPMMQDPPDYDENGILQNASLRFVKTHRATLEDWHIDNWGAFEAEHSENNTVSVSRTNMPISVTHVDKVTGKTFEIKW